MKTAVIYRSQTGFTKQYAEWITEAVQADCYAFDDAKNKDFSDYDVIIFGSWFHAGGIQKLDWFKEQMPKLSDKKLIVFCVGASPAYSPDVEPAIRHCFNDEQWEMVKTFYCPGGLRYDKMRTSSRLLMKMFAKSINLKKNKSDSETAMAEMMCDSYDNSDRKYIEPIISYIN